MRVWKMCLIFFVPALVQSQTAGPSRFQIAEFRARGQIEEVIPADLDGDNIKELIVTHHSNPPGGTNRRYISVYWAGPGCKYLSNQSVEVEVAQRFTLYDFGAIPGEPGQVIVALSRNTAEYYRFVNKTLEGPLPLLKFSNQLIQISDPDRILYHDFLYDWNQDGQNEIMIYQMFESDLFYYSQDKWVQSAIDLPMDSRNFAITPLRKMFPHGEINVHYQTPSIFIHDREGDGKPELFVINDEDVWIYKLNPDGIYNEKPAYRLFLNLMDPKERIRQRSQLTVQIADLDDDGKADMITNYQYGGFFNQRADLKIFFGKDQWAETNKALKPSRAWTMTSWVIGPFIRDVNADKNADLIMPTVQIGVVSAAQVLITNNFPFDFQYYISSDHKIPEQPTTIDQASIRIDFTEGKMIGGFPTPFGDFNGDGIDDMVLGKGEQELMVVIKDRMGKRTNQQELIRVPTAIIPLVEDLNADNKADIILVYQMDPDRQGEFRVLINQGNW